MSEFALKATVDSRDAAETAGLTYASTDAPGLTRRRAGKGFSFRSSLGAPITDKASLKRIRALAIPPAWTDIWICPDPRGHIQAVGVDEKNVLEFVDAGRGIDDDKAVAARGGDARGD